MKNNADSKAELISSFNEETLSVEFLDDWKKWAHRDQLVGFFSEINLFCLQIFATVKGIQYCEPVWTAEKHFSTIQKYTGDSISSIVNECICLNFKGTKTFYTRWKPNPIGISCCARVWFLLHVWVQLIWIKKVPSPSCFSLYSLKVNTPASHAPPLICVHNCSLTQFNQNETG